MGLVRAGIDVGGTFTDLALWDGIQLLAEKVLTTPGDQSDGVVSALAAAGAVGVELVHGTTVATNALLERSGTRTVLVTDAGFEDVLEIGRQDRPALYDVAMTRPVPLVEPRDRIGVPGRSAFVDSGLSSGDRADLAAAILDAEPEAVAISTLFSFLNPSRERELASVVADVAPAAALSLSSAVAPEFREFERTSTTVINAYLMPSVVRYLKRLGEAVRAAGVVGAPAVMRSSGGLIGLDVAAALPAAVVLSGPAGGVIATAALGSMLGHPTLVSFDMGGTSTDVCRIVDGRPEVTFERSVGGLPNLMPSVAVHTVGAGGGSIGWIDGGGALRVGPKSAGSVPGPAAYGLGGSDPTVTDANVVAGRLGGGSPLAGSLALDRQAALASLERLGAYVEMDSGAIALGMLQVVEAHMERAVRRVSIEEGSDPRDAVLVAFGGAGGLHATALARRLEMAGVVIPPHAGVFSALGLLLAPPRADVVMSALLRAGSNLDAMVAEARQRAATDLGATGSRVASIESTVDVRYWGQSHETQVTYSPGDGWDVLESRFHEVHARRNGFARPGDRVEVVAARAAAVGQPALTLPEMPPFRPEGVAGRGSRSVLTPTGEVEADVWWRPALGPGSKIPGPAVIEEPNATTFLGSGELGVVDDSGALEVRW